MVTPLTRYNTTKKVPLVGLPDHSWVIDFRNSNIVASDGSTLPQPSGDVTPSVDGLRVNTKAQRTFNLNVDFNEFMKDCVYFVIDFKLTNWTYDPGEWVFFLEHQNCWFSQGDHWYLGLKDRGTPERGDPGLYLSCLFNRANNQDITERKGVMLINTSVTVDDPAFVGIGEDHLYIVNDLSKKDGISYYKENWIQEDPTIITRTYRVDTYPPLDDTYYPTQPPYVHPLNTTNNNLVFNLEPGEILKKLGFYFWNTKPANFPPTLE